MSRVLRSHVEEALSILADVKRQSRLWLASAGPEVSSFTECVSQLWDDSGLDGAFDRGETVFSPDIDRRLVELGKILDRIDPFQKPEAILQDPRLLTARELARRLLEDIQNPS